MLVNIHFNNLYASNTAELYLYHRLRWHAKNNGGYIYGFNFSKTEMYDLMPKLIKRGWVTKDKIIKHRAVLSKNNCSNYSARITEYELSSIENFKGFLIASCEAYVIGTKCKKEDKTNSSNLVGYKKKGGKDSVLSKKNENKKLGEVINSNISRLMGISVSSVTRWRRLSNTLNYNSYVLFADVSGRCNIPSTGATITAVPKLVGYASLLNEVKVRKSVETNNKGFTSKRYGGFVKFKLEVTSGIEIFVNSKRLYKNGSKGLQ